MYTVPDHYNYLTFQTNLDSLEMYKRRHRRSAECCAQREAEGGLPNFIIENLRDIVQRNENDVVNQIRQINRKFNIHREDLLKQFCYDEKCRRETGKPKGILLYYKKQDELNSFPKRMQSLINRIKKNIINILRYLHECMQHARICFSR